MVTLRVAWRTFKNHLKKFPAFKTFSTEQTMSAQPTIDMNRAIKVNAKAIFI